ncbi:MAG TPA: amidohydrolase family protein [Armatimonadota bacterium]|nr:amidohydrolase family protein [Armatimonadota bacterium]
MSAEASQIIDANTMFGIHPAHKLDMSPERLIRDMDRHRIAGSLTLSTIGVFHDHVIGNMATLEAAKANNRLVPVATINPDRYFGEDLSSIRSQGFKIVRFFADADSHALKAILKQINVPIMLDSRPASVPSDYPAPIILCSVTNETLSEALAVMAELPNVMLETHCLTALGALETAVGKVGPDRVIFGSGAPILSVAGALSYILSAELSDDDKAKILGGNIRRILEGG